MLLSVDNPDAVEFIAREAALTDERLEGKSSFNTLSMHARDEWRRRQEESGRLMSDGSRGRLFNLWKETGTCRHLRRQAFVLWAATTIDGDLTILRTVAATDPLHDMALAQRLIRADETAIPAFLVKLETEPKDYWWQFCRYIWSTALTGALDRALKDLGHRFQTGYSETVESGGWILAELVLRLSAEQAEQMLLKHWEALRTSAPFVQAALYIATPTLLDLVSQRIEECPTPSKLFEHLSTGLGLNTHGHPGLTRRAQVQALAPYLIYLAEHDVFNLWTICNKKGWFETRRQYIDPLFKATKYGDVEYVDRDKAFAALDKQASRHPTWIGHWIDRCREAGSSTEEIMDIVTSWFNERRTNEALQLVASAIVHMGRRSHFKDLANMLGEADEKAAPLLSNGWFVVQRRSLS